MAVHKDRPKYENLRDQIGEMANVCWNIEQLYKKIKELDDKKCAFEEREREMRTSLHLAMVDVGLETAVLIDMSGQPIIATKHATSATIKHLAKNSLLRL